MAEESGKENQTSPTGEGAKKVESAAPVPPPSKRTNDGTNELASEGPAPAPAAAPNPRKTDTSDMMKVTRKAAPAGDAVTVGQMGVSMITKSRKESEQYGYMAEDASIMFHTYAGLGVMTTNFYPRIKDTLAYNLAYSAARVRVKPALEIMRDSSMPRRGLQMYLAERDLFFGEVRGILMMQVNGCRSHYGKAPSTNTWAMSQVTGEVEDKKGKKQKFRQNTEQVLHDSIQMIRRGVHGDEVVVATRARMTIMAPLAEADLLNMISGLLNQLLDDPKWSVEFKKMVRLYRETLYSRVRDMPTEQLINSEELRTLQEFTDMAARLTVLRDVVALLAYQPWVQAALAPGQPGASEVTSLLADVKPWDLVVGQAGLAGEVKDTEFGPRSDGFTDPQGVKFPTIGVLLTQSAVMQAKMAYERLRNIIPKVLAQRPNLIGTDIYIPTFDLFLEKLEVLIEVLSMIPELRNMTNTMIYENIQIRTQGGFSAHMFDPIFHRVHYAVVKPDGMDFTGLMSPFEDTYSVIAKYPVSQVTPLFVVDRAAHGMTMTGITKYARSPAMAVEDTQPEVPIRGTGVEDADLTRARPSDVFAGEIGTGKKKKSVQLSARMHTNVDIQHLGWMIPFVTPIDERTYEKLYDAVYLPTSRSYQPLKFEMKKYVTKMPPAGEKTANGVLGLEEKTVHQMLIPLAPFALVGAPVAMDFVFQPIVTKFREENGFEFKMKGPILIPDDAMYPADMPDSEKLLYSELVVKHKEAKDVIDEKMVTWLV